MPTPNIYIYIYIYIYITAYVTYCNKVETFRENLKFKPFSDARPDQMFSEQKLIRI